jgi:tRNA(fMet)-specific endonuclease VapC
VTRYILDTNAASYLVKNRNSFLNSQADRYAKDICISCLTEAELLFGLANNSAATRLANSVKDFLRGIDILPWDSAAAHAYAGFKHSLRLAGLALGPVDMLIAAHSLAADATLVTADRAFHKASALLRLENWLA